MDLGGRLGGGLTLARNWGSRRQIELRVAHISGITRPTLQCGARMSSMILFTSASTLASEEQGKGIFLKLLGRLSLPWSARWLYLNGGQAGTVKVVTMTLLAPTVCSHPLPPHGFQHLPDVHLKRYGNTYEYSRVNDAPTAGSLRCSLGLVFKDDPTRPAILSSSQRKTIGSLGLARLNSASGQLMRKAPEDLAPLCFQSAF